jgi:hypothetical protein
MADCAITGSAIGSRCTATFQKRDSGSPARQASASRVAASASIRRRGRGRMWHRLRTSASSARQASSAVVCTLTVGGPAASPTSNVYTLTTSNDTLGPSPVNDPATTSAHLIVNGTEPRGVRNATRRSALRSPIAAGRRSRQRPSDTEDMLNSGTRTGGIATRVNQSFHSRGRVRSVAPTSVVRRSTSSGE